MNKKNISFKTKNHKDLIIRTFIGLVGVTSYFVGITKVDMVQASLIEQLAPVCIIISSMMFLKEKISKEKYIFMIITLIGAIVAVNPLGVDFNGYSVFIIIDVIATGGLIVILRKLILSKEPAIRIVFYYGVYSLLILTPIAVFTKFDIGGTKNLMLLILIGICFTAKQFLSAESLKYLEANQAGIIRYSEIIYSIIFGMVLFGEHLKLNSVIGGSIIVIGILVDYKIENRKKCVMEIKH